MNFASLFFAWLHLHIPFSALAGFYREDAGPFFPAYGHRSFVIHPGAWPYCCYKCITDKLRREAKNSRGWSARRRKIDGFLIASTGLPLLLGMPSHSLVSPCFFVQKRGPKATSSAHPKWIDNLRSPFPIIYICKALFYNTHTLCLAIITRLVQSPFKEGNETRDRVSHILTTLGQRFCGGPMLLPSTTRVMYT